MEQIKKYLFELMNSVNSIYEIDRRTYKAEIDEITRTLRDAPDKERKLLDYERKFNINDSYYTFLLQKKSEAQMRKAANAPDNSVLQKARVSALINGGYKKDKYTFALTLGLLIPAILILLKELLNFTIRTEKDVEKLSKIQLIGAISHTRHNTDDKIIATKYPNSVFVENLRVIRTKIELLIRKRTNFIVLFSSAESGDGKTYVSANFAGIFALQKKKVLLIDFDLRRPNLTNILLGQNNKKIGFVNYIIGDIPLEEAIIPLPEYGIDFLPSGIMPPNPGEFVRIAKIPEMLNDLRKIYDFIVIDTSPIGLVADAHQLMQVCDINLIVVRSFKTSKGTFKDVTKRIYNDGIKNIYVIMNDLNQKKLGYAYGYGYSDSNESNYYSHEYFEQNELSKFQQFISKCLKKTGEKIKVILAR